MHVCGTHEDTVWRFGLRNILPENVSIVPGPGCPVCVTPPEYIDLSIQLSFRSGVVLATYGDMYRVPGTRGSLKDARARGGKILIVYSPCDAVEYARRHPEREVVFFAIGFETTAPSTAAILKEGPPKNFSVLVCHRLIPPVIDYLLGLGETGIHGFILPGHVSTIIGWRAYEFISKKWRIPQVVAGFEPLDVLIAVAMLLRQIREGRAEVENEYTRSVRPEGNILAKKLIEEVFRVVDARWRGIGVVPSSGLELKEEYEKYDVRVKMGVELEPVEKDFSKACLCGEVLRGVASPFDCPLFGRACNPNHPVGPCMVSVEGACSIAYKYGGYSEVKRKLMK